MNGDHSLNQVNAQVMSAMQPVYELQDFISFFDSTKGYF